MAAASTAAPEHVSRVATWSRGIARTPAAASVLGATGFALRPPATEPVDAIVGWGTKPNTKIARGEAKARRVPYLALEDGFYRSIGLGVEGAPPLSVVVDDLGIYYDARHPSRLEHLIAVERGDAELKRARRCIDQIVGAGLSKYNVVPPPPEGDTILGPRTADLRRILIIDQTAGDQSLEQGFADATTFRRMLADARASEGAEVIVKTHPDVASGKRRGHFSTRDPGSPARWLTEPCNAQALLGEVDEVYVATSQFGFEALLAGKPVTCYGVPFYAGWGLTNDRPTEDGEGAPAGSSAALQRRHEIRAGTAVSVERLFAAACLDYARYVHPLTGERCEAEVVLEHLALQLRMFAENRGRTFCYGFTLWKRNYVRQYLRSPVGEVRFIRSAAQAKRRGFTMGDRLVVWGQREDDSVRTLAREHGVDISRMEDGFLRSVGLGSDLTAPASLVVDRRGIYYDPNHPSDLEHILQHAEFSAEEVTRAGALKRAMVSARVSKYNVGGSALKPPPAGKRVVLVVGQVEDDASIRLGCVDVRTNVELLRIAREARPDAYLIYKPHPDVVSGNRAGAADTIESRRLCDDMVLDAPLVECLDVADEVHTMTSLVGFEALLREREVHVYGRPFYAGWGLTHDRNQLERRQRSLSLDELVAGVLIRYPRYLHPTLGVFTTPENIVTELQRSRERDVASTQLRIPWHRRQARKLTHVWKGLANVR